jgi:4-amino-4-deoxy-L-arabinose transferase-like glycosyltransferase
MRLFQERLRFHDKIDWYISALIVAIYGFFTILVQPFGDFPLNDDWSYAIATRRLVEDGFFLPTQWTSMTLLSQVVWGGIFCKLFGFSFNILRFSTWFAGSFSLILIYQYCRKYSEDRLLALIASCTLAFNPLFFNLSLNFMTDVPSLFFNLLTAGLMMAYLIRKSDGYLVLSAILSVICVLVRQNGLFLPIAFCITLLLFYPFSFQNLIKAIFPLVVSWGALSQFEMWLSKTGRTPLLYGLQITAFRETFVRLHDHLLPTLKYISSNMIAQFLELGGFMLPLTIWVAYGACHKDFGFGAASTRLRFAFTILGLMIGIEVILQGNAFPFMENILHNGGIGPLTLHDTTILGMSNYTGFPRWLWIFLALLCAMGMVLLFWFLFEIASDLLFKLKNHALQTLDAVSIFILVCFFVYTGPLSLIHSLDRYLIVPIALLCILFCIGYRHFLHSSESFCQYKMAATFSLVLLWGWYSLAGTHDYFSWNRTRFQMLHELIDSGVPASKIDGGFEFNGLALHDNAFWETHSVNSTRSIRSNHPRSWWWVQDDEYLITFGTIPNTQVEKMETFSRWFPFTNGRLYLLKRDEK